MCWSWGCFCDTKGLGIFYLKKKKSQIKMIKRKKEKTKQQKNPLCLCHRKTRLHKSVLPKAAAGNSRTRMKEIQLHKAVLLFVGFLFLHLTQYRFLFSNSCGLRAVTVMEFTFSKVKKQIRFFSYSKPLDQNITVQNITSYHNLSSF